MHGAGTKDPERKLRRIAGFAAGGVVVGVLFLWQLGAFGSSEPPDTAFDEARALQTLTELCSKGQRHYGAAKRAESVAHLQSLLEPLVDQTALQRFSALEQGGGQTYDLVNIVGRLNPSAKRRIILGAHFDTRLWAEQDEDPAARNEPITGANDGTSGVAVLVEVARVLKTRQLHRIGVDYVLFDGHEFGRPDNGDACRGSRYFASHLRGLYPGQLPAFAIIVNMVGDCDQRFQPEASSARAAPDLIERIWDAADHLGYGSHFGADGLWEVAGDHTALNRAKVPAVLVVDFEYPFWHTQADTVDKVCAESLGRVGNVLVKIVLDEEARDD